MKKYLWLSLITIVLSFGSFGCSKDGKGFFAKNGDYSRISGGVCPFFPSFQPRYVDNPEIENLKRIFRQKGFEEREIFWMAKIATEDYGQEVWPILYVGGHFIYGPFDGNTYSNCPLYSLKRFLRHLGLLGIVDQDLWYRWSDRQLRDIGVDELGFHQRERSQHVVLLQNQITMLVKHLTPEAIPHLKHGCAREIAVRERQNTMQSLGIFHDLTEILEAEQRDRVEIAINMAIERGFKNIERLRNHRFNLDALRNEINRLQHRIDDYDQRGYFLEGSYGLVLYSKDIERVHNHLEFLRRNP
ncbi:MAG: hypothetical protein LBS38_03955 [Endomicrobium sp.]|jgi:hypothetical protein|nr:hypothetical protein [Endomicrobium sp.]